MHTLKTGQKSYIEDILMSIFGQIQHFPPKLFILLVVSMCGEVVSALTLTAECMARHWIQEKPFCRLWCFLLEEGTDFFSATNSQAQDLKLFTVTYLQILPAAPKFHIFRSRPPFSSQGCIATAQRGVAGEICIVLMGAREQWPIHYVVSIIYGAV